MSLLSNAASLFITLFASRKRSCVFSTVEKKVLHTDLRSYLQVRECHLKNNYPSLVLVILCFHESHFAQKGRMTLAHQEEVDLLKTVILFLRLPLSPP